LLEPLGCTLKQYEKANPESFLGHIKKEGKVIIDKS
jgi:hypothetical protein